MLQIHTTSLFVGEMFAAFGEGHCGALGPKFFTRQSGRRMISEYRAGGAYGYRGSQRLLTEVAGLSLPEDYATFVAEMGKRVLSSASSICDVMQDDVGWLIRRSGIVIHSGPITYFAEAVELLEHFVRTEICNAEEAFHLLRLMVLDGLPEWPSFCQLRRMGLERHWDVEEGYLSVVGQDLLRGARIGVHMGR